ncbi:hypothetical protein L6R52_34425 [Myxococcota bacterium]|nr:hypothetical protein [Myxococcota bacterium]
MTSISGRFNNQIIHDTKGTTQNSLSGDFNNVRYVGDSGANTFRVGGTRNKVSIENVGRDENIQLEGRPQDWAIAPDCNPRDGKVTYVNKITGNEVTVKTDAGRNDNFVKSKVSFTGDYASLARPSQMSCGCVGGWNQIGNMALNPGAFAYAQGYAAGVRDSTFAGGAYAQGYAAGVRDGSFLGAVGAWASFAPLPFGCWSRLF